MAGQMNPGSEAAREAGCRCPVIDNHHGLGIFIGAGHEPVFWISDACPLHGPHWREELEMLWPEMPNLEGKDLFAHCGPSAGEPGAAA